MTAELLFIHVLDSSFIISVGSLGGWLLRLQLVDLLFLSERLLCTHGLVAFPVLLSLNWDIEFPPRDLTFSHCYASMGFMNYVLLAMG